MIWTAILLLAFTWTMQFASVARFCCCGCPCQINAPSNIELSGITGEGCEVYNSTVDFVTFGQSDFTCFWRFSNELGVQISIHQANGAGTIGFGDCAVSLVSGEWGITMQIDATLVWSAKVVGIACDPETGKISGAVVLPDPCGVFPCGGTPTVTVPV